MNEQEMSFNGQHFLQKEAANPSGLFAKMKGLRNRPAPVSSPSNPTGTASQSAEDLAINPNRTWFYGADEVAQGQQSQLNRASTGSFTADGLLWLGKLAPGARPKIENAVGKTVGAFDRVDGKIGDWAAGSNPASLRGKLFSKPNPNAVGMTVRDDGTFAELSTGDRKNSILAPIEKTVKFTTPFLATAYVGEKLYPEGENLRDNVNQATYETLTHKTSAVFDDSVSTQMDKIASLQKIAELEEQVGKMSEDLETVSLEKNAALTRLAHVEKEKMYLEKRAATAEYKSLQKEAEHEELRLRTIAQKRSKVAVDLSQELLESNLIKQAQYKDTVDKLMECDEDTIRMYQSLVKEAQASLDSVESLAYIGEYKGSDKLAGNQDLAKSYLSKRGQSIGEAARDLIK